jgi:hypothetical protein
MAVDGSQPLEAGDSGTILGYTTAKALLPQLEIGDPVEIHAAGRCIATGVLTEFHLSAG